MGAIFGSAFARAGADVVFFDNRQDVVTAIAERGLDLDGVSGKTTARFPATTNAAELGEVDVALVLVDLNATTAIGKVAALCLRQEGFALTLQNGIGNWEALAAGLVHTVSLPDRLTTAAPIWVPERLATPTLVLQ